MTVASAKQADNAILGGDHKLAFIGRKPSRTIVVPPEFRRKTYGTEAKTLLNQVKHETGCDIDFRSKQDNTVVIQGFLIYGSQSGTEKAVAILNDWISKAHQRSSSASTWAKTKAFDADQDWYDHAEILRNQYRQRFLGSVPAVEPGQKLFTTSIDWPPHLQGQSIGPRDVFGNKLELLNPIRMRYELYIQLQRTESDSCQIIITSSNEISLDSAKSDILIQIKQAYDLEGYDNNQHVLNIVLDDAEGLEVALLKAETWWPFQSDKIAPRLIPSDLMEPLGSYIQDSIHSTHLAEIEDVIKLALEKIQAKKAAYDFAIRLGCISLESKRVRDDQVGRILEKDDFRKEIDGLGGLDVKRWLIEHKAGIKMLHRLCSETDFLEPVVTFTQYGRSYTLKNTRPSFQATWLFSDPATAALASRVPYRHSGEPTPIKPHAPSPSSKSTRVPNIMVQVTWIEDYAGGYEKQTPKFFTIDSGNMRPKRNMEVNLIELGHGRAWHFALESLITKPARTVSPILVTFAHAVQLRPDYDITSAEKFAVWEKTSSVTNHLRGYRQEMTYTYAIRSTRYRVEHKAMWCPQQKLPVWGLAVRHADWATHLAALETLPALGRVEWGDVMSMFLPKDDEHQAQAGLGQEEDLGMASLSLHDQKGESQHSKEICTLTDNLMKLSRIVNDVTHNAGASLSLI